MTCRRQISYRLVVVIRIKLQNRKVRFAPIRMVLFPIRMGMIGSGTLQSANGMFNIGMEAIRMSEQIVRIPRAVEVFGIRDIITMSVCAELAELADFQYFYEGLIRFASAKARLSKSLADRIRNDERAFQRSIYLLGNRRFI